MRSSLSTESICDQSSQNNMKFSTVTFEILLKYIQDNCQSLKNCHIKFFSAQSSKIFFTAVEEASLSAPYPSGSPDPHWIQITAKSLTYYKTQ